MSKAATPKSMRNELAESIAELELKMALLDMADEDINALEEESNQEENIRRIDEFFLRNDPKFLSLIHQGINRENTRRLAKIGAQKFARIAAIVLAVFAIGVTTAAAVMPAFRAQIFELFAKREARYTSVGLTKSQAAALYVPSEWMGKYYITYIPEGFAVSAISNRLSSCTVLMTNAANKTLRFHEYHESRAAQVDTENAAVEKTTIRGRPAIISQKDGAFRVVWSLDDVYFSIMFEGSKEEAIKIAESVARISE